MHAQAPMSLAETIRSWGTPRALHVTIREMGIPCFDLPYRAPLPDMSFDWRSCGSYEIYQQGDDATEIWYWDWGGGVWERLG